MKVKVSYTVELAEVPTLVGEILSKSELSLEGLLQETKKISKTNLNIESYNAIVGMCKKLELVRDVYEDCYSLLGSYIKTTADLSIPSPAPDPSHTPGQDVLNNLERAQKLKENLRESLGGEDD